MPIPKLKEISIIIRENSEYVVYYYIGSSLQILKISRKKKLLSELKKQRFTNLPTDISKIIVNSEDEEWRTISPYVKKKYSNTLNKEIDIDIKDIYEVSNFGRIRKKIKKGYRMLSGTRSIAFVKGQKTFAYPAIRLLLNNKSEDNKDKFATQIHFLTLSCFGNNTGVNPDGSPMNGRIVVNHKDHNKLNTLLRNLEFCDDKYNANF